MHAHQIPQRVLVHFDSRTVGWKSKSAKEYVTTHLTNGLAPKMDGAQAGDPCPTAGAIPRVVKGRNLRTSLHSAQHSYTECHVGVSIPQKSVHH